MITIMFLLSASICKAVMDTLQFHFYTSKFKKLNPQYWSPSISWRNKWKDGFVDNGESFFGSSTFLVFLTDAWHLFQIIMLVFLFCAIVFYVPIFNHFFDFILYFIIFTSNFEIFYSKILLTKKNK